MRSILVLLTLILLFPVVFRATSVRADDGIPDNCEYTQSTEQRVIIPRYSASTQRLVLVNWTSGDEIQTLDRDVPVISILGWSGDCRYIAVAEGTLEVMNTVVYDTTTSRRMGSVDDAHHKPHPITWGINDNLVVETRHGAILWNVSTGQRFTLTTSFNTTTGRNFSRLRWDAANHQLIVDLAVGGRAVYDLTTGAVVPVAAQTDARVIQNPGPQIVIGGQSYPCSTYPLTYYGWSATIGVPSIELHYDEENQLVSLQLFDISGPDATIETLENGVNASYVLARGWSANCRYLAASLGIPGRDASDTVVYDVIAGKRVGVVPDARHIPHPIQWGSNGQTLLVQTRNGGILWDLATNTQTRISSAAQIPVTGTPGVRNFNATAWSGDQLLAVPVDSPNTVVAYDPQSGAGHTVVTFAHPVRDLLDAPAGMSVAALQIPGDSYDKRIVFFRTDSSLQIALDNFYSLDEADITFSPDGQRFAALTNGDIGVWNTATGQQTGVYDAAGLDRFQFVDNVTLKAYSGAAINVQTGVYTPAAQPTSAPTIRAVVMGQDGKSASSWYSAFEGWNNVMTCKVMGVSVFYDPNQRALVLKQGHDQRVLVTNLNATRYLGWSPDCRTIDGGVQEVSNANLPYDNAPLDDIFQDEASYSVTFWDAATGATLGTILHPYRAQSPARVDWSPGGERAFVRSTTGYFIFDPATKEQIPLHYAGTVTETEEITTYYSLYWDFSNGRIFVTGWGGVLVFDLRTGERIAFLPPNDFDPPAPMGTVPIMAAAVVRSPAALTVAISTSTERDR